MLPLTPWSRRWNRRGGDRTHVLELIRLPLSPLSYAPQRVGPVGFEPTPTWLKARDTAVTPRPHTWSGVSVSIDVRQASSNSFVLWFTSGSPENRTQRNAVISRVWATSPRLPFKSGTSESNRDPPAPKAGVLPSAPVSDAVCRNRRGRFRRRISSLSVGREAIESSSAVLQTAARTSQLPAHIVGFGHEKRPDVCVTPGLHERRFKRSRCHMRKR